MSQALNLVFCGTPQFAVPTLEKLIATGFHVQLVLTQPDRPKGRGQKQGIPPVKEAALRLGLSVFQPERVRRTEIVEQLRELVPEAMVVVGYGQIIPQAILDIAPLGIINVHGSLLPKYRGAAPIQWAVANGESRTGVTTMRINAGLDTGDMLLKWETKIGPEETAVEIYLCRDPWETIKQVLRPESVVMIATLKRWWPSPEARLGAFLRRAGHRVVYV